MRVQSDGDWPEKALQISMTSNELQEWLNGFTVRSEPTPKEIAIREGKVFHSHYYLLEGGIRMIIYEDTQEKKE